MWKVPHCNLHFNGRFPHCREEWKKYKRKRTREDRSKTGNTSFYTMLYWLRIFQKTDGSPFCSTYRPFCLYLRACNCVQKCKKGRIWKKTMILHHKNSLKCMHIQDSSVCRSLRSNLSLRKTSRNQVLPNYFSAILGSSVLHTFCKVHTFCVSMCVF